MNPGMVPDANRREMQEKGVDWDFLADEIRSLSSNDLLPSGLTAATALLLQLRTPQGPKSFLRNGNRSGHVSDEVLNSPPIAC